MTTKKFRTLAAVSLLGAGLTLTACGSDAKNTVADATSAAASAVSEASAAASSKASEVKADLQITLSDGYIGAKEEGKEMTALFGTVKNHSDKEIHITSVSGSLDAKYEIHEVKDGVMSENPDGLRIPAKGEVVLKPGADHIMIMAYTKAIEAGDNVDIVLHGEDGTEYDLGEVPVRVQQSTHEHYAGNTEGAEATTGHEGHEGHGDGHEGHAH